MNESTSASVAERIEAYHSDFSWVADICSFYRLDESTFAEFLACYFRHRVDPRCPVKLPEWALQPDDVAWQRERDIVCARRRWSRDTVGGMQSMIHLELMARDASKLPLHTEWLQQLDKVVVPGRPFRTIDFGSGASSFSALALTRPESHCTLVDVDGLDYLRFRYRAFGERVKVEPLVIRPGALNARARVHEDVSALRGPFEAVVMADVLEHTLNPLATLRHLFAQATPGGLLFINYPDEIEGIWHTPEANHLRRWCYRFLNRCARPEGRFSWIKQADARALATSLLFAVLQPALRWQARRFARRYFADHGESIVRQSRAEGFELTLQQLLRSVDG